MDIINHIQLKLDALPMNEALARRIVGEFALSVNPTIEELEDIKTCVSEAVTNCIIHGYNEENIGEIRLDLCLHKNKLAIIIEDDGIGIEDINIVQEPFYTTKPDKERSGMGFTLMKSFMNEFYLESRPQHGTKVCMTKYFVQEEDNARAE